MVNQELMTIGDKSKARIGVFNIIVTNEGKDIEVYKRTMYGKRLLFKYPKEE